MYPELHGTAVHRDGVIRSEVLFRPEYLTPGGELEYLGSYRGAESKQRRRGNALLSKTAQTHITRGDVLRCSLQVYCRHGGALVLLVHILPCHRSPGNPQD